MEIVIAPNRFQRILNIGLIGGGFEDIASATGYFRQDGLYIDDKKSPFVGVKAFFPTHYFVEYKTENDELITLTSTMLEPFKWTKAFEQEKLRIKTDKNKIHYIGKDKQEQDKEFWWDNLQEVKESKFAFQMPDSDKGFLPKGQPEIVQALLEVSQMKVHTCDYYRLISDGKTLQVEVTEPGTYKRTLNLTQIVKLGELSYQVSGKVFEAIVGMFSGEVWFTLYEKAIVISQKTKEASLTYLFVPRSE